MFRYLPQLLFLSFLIISNFSNLHAQTIEDRITQIINKMTTEEKILQLHGEGGFNTADNMRLGIPGFIMADGPHGVRDGLSTAFPVGISMAATWDVNMIQKVGVAMGYEFRGKGKNQMLGPCMDLTRDPRNGRTPESGGEDPYLCAQITTAVINGVQSTGCIATAKHFNGVNKQINRFNNDDFITERQLFENYGLNFRNAVQQGGALSVMNSYNLINGAKSAENKFLLTDILRTAWGFPYYVVSDWGSIWSSEKAINAGCNICMGSDNYKNDLPGLVSGGTVSMDVIDNAVRNVLRTKILAGMLDYYPQGDPAKVNSKENQEICLEAGREAIILLKNENSILPLKKSAGLTIALIGPSANVTQVDGSGSSYVDPYETISPRQGFINKIGSTNVLYAKGCDINSADTSGFSDARAKAASANYVVFLGGLDASQEGEGFDRVTGSINLPGQQQNLINELAKSNKNIIVVLESGGICGISKCVNNIKGLLYAFYPGQEGGQAIADVIFGDYNPAGRLPVTYPVNDAQLPAWDADFTNDYGCGYRWFDEKNIKPLYAFGYGLSYTTFEYSNLVITPNNAPVGQTIHVSVDIKNTGSVAGDEVPQLYLNEESPSVEMPRKQLKGFERINIQPGETKTVTFNLTNESFYYYDEMSGGYKVNAGSYNVMVGNSSDNLTLSGKINLSTSSPKPDLLITHIKVVPPYPVKGDSVTFLTMVKNQGTGASPAGTVHEVKFMVNGEEISLSTEFNKEIPVGGMALLCANTGPNGSNRWKASETGRYLVEAIVDDQNKIDECIENNNSDTTSFTVYNKPPENIALGKSVQVSSIEKAGLEGDKAVDGNPIATERYQRLIG